MLTQTKFLYINLVKSGMLLQLAANNLVTIGVFYKPILWIQGTQKWILLLKTQNRFFARAHNTFSILYFIWESKINRYYVRICAQQWITTTNTSAATELQVLTQTTRHGISWLGRGMVGVQVPDLAQFVFYRRNTDGLVPYLIRELKLDRLASLSFFLSPESDDWALHNNPVEAPHNHMTATLLTIIL